MNNLSQIYDIAERVGNSYQCLLINFCFCDYLGIFFKNFFVVIAIRVKFGSYLF